MKSPWNNRRIVPGFIDIHCHGAYGYDTNYAEPEGLKKWAKGIPSEGVTGFLSTTITAGIWIFATAMIASASMSYRH